MQKQEAVYASRREDVPLSINDPRPVGEVAKIWRTAAQAATIGIFVILLIATLSMAQPVLLPVASAFVVTMMLGPLSAHANSYGVPALLTAIVLWLLAIAVFYGLIMLLAAPVLEWVGKAPDIGRKIQEKLLLIERPLTALRDLRNALPLADAKNGFAFDITSVLQPMVAIITPAIGQIFIFFGTLFFMLLGRTRMRHLLVAFFDEREARLRTIKIMNDIESNLTGYLSTVAVINFSVGLVAGAIAWATGLPDPTAWVVLGFILNFIPYIGALIMVILLFLVGLVTFPLFTQAIVAPLLYVAVATVEGHFLTPSIIGRQLTLNPLTVFLSLVFWTWLWGPVGAFLAVPLLIMGLVAASHLFPKDEPALPE
ncbi:MAG: AI-2E family transporter [Rhizobiales bacterium]|nr:AI-2E family transporter [Hyphomicrobiales bacterium]